jgi:TetR/AcrR family transcriptional repressor of lmrAB and yxaGH operons
VEQKRRKGAETRARLLDATQDLLESGGYFGAGLNQVIAAGNAPRGSLYFHFPGGKDQLVSESVRRAGDAMGAALAEIAEAAPTAEAMIEGVLTFLGDRLESSGWRKGCPVATVALEMAAVNDPLQEACSQVYSSWESALRAELDGRPGADDLAVTILALVEGALVLARAHRSREPLERVGRQVASLLAG